MHNSQKNHRTVERVLFDSKNPRALIHLVPDAFGKMFRKHWEINPGIFHLNERELVKEMRRMKQAPTALEKELRYNFWFEFNRVMNEARVTHMQLPYVIGRTFSKEQFYQAITRPLFMAYIILPPESYAMKTEIALDIATDKLIEYLENADLSATSVIQVLKIQQSLLAKTKSMAVPNPAAKPRYDLPLVKKKKKKKALPPIIHAPELSEDEAKIEALRSKILAKQREKEALFKALNPVTPIDGPEPVSE